MKKGKYIYYHCTGYKGKCPEPYTWEEVLEAQFSDLIQGFALDEEVLTWLTTALKASHEDEQRFHDEAISRLQAEYAQLQKRIDAMYIDKLDGRIDTAFYDRMAWEWRLRQDELQRSIEGHQSAHRTYLDEGVRLLELAAKAHVLFDRQPPHEKRRLLDLVLSNCIWKDGKLRAEYRQPFDLLRNAAVRAHNEKAVGGISDGQNKYWLRR